VIRIVIRWIGFLCCFLGGADALCAQVSSSIRECKVDAAKIRIPTAVVSLQPLRFVRGLTADKFRVKSGNEILRTECFSPPDKPYTVGLVIDYSDSVPSDSIKVFLEGVLAFLKAANDKNTYFGVGLRSKPFVMLEPTSDETEIENFLVRARDEKISGRTSLNDTIKLALSKFPSDDDPRRILLVASDGNENNSRSSDTKGIAKNLREAGVRVFVFKYNNSGQRNTRWVEADSDARLFGFAAETSGSGAFYSNLEPIDRLLENLSKQLREEYTVGFTPANAENKWRPLILEVKVPTEHPAIQSTGAQRFFY
jgi:Ca-activated chloride channel homolog